MKFVLLLAILFLSNGNDQAFKKLSTLKGLWKMKTAKETIYEEWQTSGENSMNGRSYELQGKDTIVDEHILLQNTDSAMFYIVTSTNQNDQQPVSFKLVSSKNQTFIFENKQHDFPQRIIYRFVTNDSVVARIEGNKNGKTNSFDFKYSRMK